ncbi:unnamed protein product [Camellia sinensis]
MGAQMSDILIWPDIIYQSWIDGSLGIVNAIMSRRDVFVIMVAGGRKSLCYQLPAILLDGVALVFLQVMGLAALGIPAFKLTLTTAKEDEKFINKALEKGEGELKILYVTPGKISKSKRFMSLEKCHHAGHLSLISIDTAPCCKAYTLPTCLYVYSSRVLITRSNQGYMKLQFEMPNDTGSALVHAMVQAWI